MLRENRANSFCSEGPGGGGEGRRAGEEEIREAGSEGEGGTQFSSVLDFPE